MYCIPNITNNYTLHELNLTAQEAKVLQEEANPNKYNCDNSSKSTASSDSDSSDSEGDIRDR